MSPEGSLVSSKSAFSSGKPVLSHRSGKLIPSLLEYAERILRVKWKGLPAEG